LSPSRIQLIITDILLRLSDIPWLSWIKHFWGVGKWTFGTGVETRVSLLGRSCAVGLIKRTVLNKQPEPVIKNGLNFGYILEPSKLVLYVGIGCGCQTMGDKHLSGYPDMQGIQPQDRPIFQSRDDYYLKIHSID
jgi:hypothetical protein